MNRFIPIVLLLVCTSVSLASYEDARCKCVCVDRQGSYNGTRPTGKIFVKAIAADQCSCKFMLDKESALCPYCDCKYQVRNTTTIKVVVCFILVIISALTLYMIFLLLLEPLLSARRAGYKTAGTGDLAPKSIKSAYDAAWWISRSASKVWTGNRGDQPVDSEDTSTEANRTRQRSFRPSPIGSLTDSRPETITSTPPIAPPHVTFGSGVTTTTVGGVSTVVRSVRNQQQRWKGDVEAQRARVFSEHTLLN